ncbi:hypothetical protein JCM18237_28020 [Halorubrum luteum]
MSRRKGTKPEQYAGPFQEYSSVPQRYCLKTYAGHYTGEETWKQYCEQVLFGQYDSDYIRRSARRAGSSWKDHMASQGRHHALATPNDVDEWCRLLLDGGRNRRTCYENYYVRIYNFYEHLKRNCQHPHLYNPLLMAAIEYDVTRRVWMYRIDARPEVTERDE